MKAVNLIPEEMRRGSGAGVSRSGGAVYILLGGLVALVAMAGVYALTVHKVSQRKAQIATVSREADIAQARADALAPYVAVQAAKAKRLGTISTLMTSRFDWSVAMRQIAEALPSDATLSAMRGTTSTSAGTGSGAASAGAGAASGLRGSLPVPAVELSGCSPTQPRVAAAIDSLRNIPGVTVVSLGSSSKASAATAGNTSAAPSGGGCASNAPSFSLVVFYTNPTAPGAPQASSASVAAPRPTVAR